MGSHSLEPQLPAINFKGLDLNRPFGSDWQRARTEVIDALENYGCFDVVNDQVQPEIRKELFEVILPNVFALPLEVKHMNESNVHLGYLGQKTDVPYESLRVQDAPNSESVERFAQMLWPEGNRKFCNTVATYAQQVCNLEQIVERMIFQSLGIAEYCNSHLESLIYGLRLSDYGSLVLVEEAKVSLPAHVDASLITIVNQNVVEGLEVCTKDGEWFLVVPSPDTCTVMIGESMEVLTNGRFHPAVHRVSVNQKRYSVMLSSLPKEGYLIQPPEEIVDENHPLQFHPCDTNKYLQFKFSPEGLRTKNPLKAFCGVQNQEKRASLC